MMTPEKAMERPKKDGFNSETVAIATPIIMKAIGGSSANSVLIPYSKYCSKAINGATKIYKFHSNVSYIFKIATLLYLIKGSGIVLKTQIGKDDVGTK